MGLATDTTVYTIRRGEAPPVNTLTFTIRASDSSWHLGLSGRPLLPRESFVSSRILHASQIGSSFVGVVNWGSVFGVWCVGVGL